MSSPDLTPQEAARWALHAGHPLDEAQHAAVAATAQQIQAVIATLRELDFGDTHPAASYHAASEAVDGTV
ncbi:hypothetical protein AAHZ94_35790 [Streptomyces sp. HSW2009]|uniref:hypothetical protein n=1 Tax=Streptomyces sp. HSW2009 TaxID=3142890 RepID=UPI0032ED96A8